MLLVVLLAAGNASWTLFLTPVILALLLVFASGMGLLFALFNVFYRDVSYIVTVILQLLFYATPVIWAPSQLLGPTHKHGELAVHILSYNPLFQYVEAFRDALWEGHVPSLTRWAWMLGSAIVSIAIGLAVFVRFSRDVGEEL